MKFGSSLQTILILFDLTKPWLPQAIIVSHWPVCKKVFPSETTVQIGFKLYRNCVMKVLYKYISFCDSDIKLGRHRQLLLLDIFRGV